MSPNRPPVIIRALVIDDEQDGIDECRDRLNRFFDEFGWNVSWDEETDPEAGRRRIIANAPYNLVIADLMFPRGSLPDAEEDLGMELIAAAAQFPQTFVLAITTGRDHTPNLLSDARYNGAHHATLRRDFSRSSLEHSPEIIAYEIRQHFIAHGTITVCEIDADGLDPAVQSLLNTVGELTLVQLYQKILQAAGHETAQIEVRPLTQGVSGAWVCTVSAQVSGIGKISHVLKLSTSRQQLRSEAEHGKKARDVLPTNLLVRLEPAQPVGPVNDWYALAGPLVQDAVTWRNWLTTGPKNRQIADVLETLFVDSLGPAYANGGPQRADPIGNLALSHLRQRRVLQALNELEEVLAHPEGGMLGAYTAEIKADLIAFISEGRLPHVLKRSVPQETFTVFAHGDLHGGNLLITTRSRPFPQLIDASEFGRMHWATDPAQFAIDIVMRGVDAGSDSMFFSGLKIWCSLIADFSRGDRTLRSVNKTERTSPALAALSWLAGNLPRICPPLSTEPLRELHRWEWHLALATYLLRAAYQPDIPGPKRCSALVAAHQQLTAAATILPRNST